MQLVLGGLCRGMTHTSTSLYAFLQLVAWPRLVGKYITYCNTYPILDWSWKISSANEEGLITIGCWEYRQSIFAVGSYHFLSSTTMDWQHHCTHILHLLFEDMQVVTISIIFSYSFHFASHHCHCGEFQQIALAEGFLLTHEFQVLWLTRTGWEWLQMW